MALNPSNSSNLEQLALKGLTLICQKIKTSRDLDHAHLGAVCHHRAGGKTPYPAVGKQGASHLYLGGSNSLAPALVMDGMRPLDNFRGDMIGKIPQIFWLPLLFATWRLAMFVRKFYFIWGNISSCYRTVTVCEPGKTVLRRYLFIVDTFQQVFEVVRSYVFMLRKGVARWFLATFLEPNNLDCSCYVSCVVA